MNKLNYDLNVKFSHFSTINKEPKFNIFSFIQENIESNSMKNKKKL